MNSLCYNNSSSMMVDDNINNNSNNEIDLLLQISDDNSIDSLL